MTNPQLAMDFSRGRNNSVSKRVHACAIVPKKASMQDKVFALIEMSADKGMTVYEVSDALKVPYQAGFLNSASPARL